MSSSGPTRHIGIERRLRSLQRQLAIARALPNLCIDSSQSLRRRAPASGVASSSLIYTWACRSSSNFARRDPVSVSSSSTGICEARPAFNCVVPLVAMRRCFGIATMRFLFKALGTQTPHVCRLDRPHSPAHLDSLCFLAFHRSGPSPSFARRRSTASSSPRVSMTRP